MTEATIHHRLLRALNDRLRALGSWLGATLARGPIGKVWHVGTGIVRGFVDTDVMGLSAELSYRWLLAIFPLAIMTAAISGFVARTINVQDPTDQLLNAAGSSLPPALATTIRPQLERVLGNQDGALLSIGLLLTIYAASSGIRAIIKGLNRAYGVQEKRPFWRQILVALALTLLLGGAVVVSFVVLVIGQVAATEVAATIGVKQTAAWLFEVAPFPLAILALAVASGFVYWAAPARHLEWRWILPGVVIFVPGWILATVLLSFYVANFGSYDDTYGAIGGAIVLLLWFYVTALILLLGGVTNAVLERELRRSGRPAARPVDSSSQMGPGEPMARPTDDERAEQTDA